MRYMRQAKKMHKKNGLFFYLILLTLFFLMLELSFFIQGSGLYLGDFKFVAHHLHIPVIVLPGIIFYIGAQCLVHFSYAVFIWAMTHFFVQAIPRLKKNSEMTGMVFWLLGLVTILLANQYYFPNSKFSYLMGNLLPASIVKYIYGLFFSIFLCMILVAVVGFFFFYYFIKKIKK
jgi:hypothetical protein